MRVCVCVCVCVRVRVRVCASVVVFVVVVLGRLIFLSLFRTPLSLVVNGKLANSGRLTWVRHSSRMRAALPNPISVRAVFSCVQTMVWLAVLEILNVVTDVDAYDCTHRGL